MAKDIEITKSCGNVFTDLGLDDADELYAKSNLAIEIIKIIKRRGLTQAQAAKILGTDRSRISKLHNGNELRHFTIDRLLSWLTKLDRDVTLTIKRKPKHRDCGRLNVSM